MAQAVDIYPLCDTPLYVLFNYTVYVHTYQSSSHAWICVIAIFPRFPTTRLAFPVLACHIAS